MRRSIREVPNRRNRVVAQRLAVVAVAAFLLVTILQPVVMTPQVSPSAQPSESPVASPKPSFRFP